MKSSDVSTYRNEPRYSIIARQIAADIERGRFPVNELLPTESELMRDFGASRHTVRSAISQLRNMGLVATRRGRGSEVISRRPVQTSPRFSFDSLNNFLVIAEVTKLVKKRKTSIRVNDVLSQATGWKAGERCLQITALRSFKTDPSENAYLEIYIRGQYAAIESKIGRKAMPISKLIEEEFSIVTKELRQTVAPELVSQSAADSLGVKKGSLGLLVCRNYISESNETYLYVVSHQAGDGAHLEMRLHYEPRSGPDG